MLPPRVSCSGLPFPRGIRRESGGLHPALPLIFRTVPGCFCPVILACLRFAFVFGLLVLCSLSQQVSGSCCGQVEFPVVLPCPGRWGLGGMLGVWVQHSACANAVARRNSLICASSGSLPFKRSLERAGVRRLDAGGIGKAAWAGERSELAPAGDKSHRDETLVGCTSACRSGAHPFPLTALFLVRTRSH